MYEKQNKNENNIYVRMRTCKLRLYDRSSWNVCAREVVNF